MEEINFTSSLEKNVVSFSSTEIGFLNTMPELTKFMEYEICDEKTLKKIKCLSNKHFEKLLNILCDQKSPNSMGVELSIYKIDIQTETFNHHINIKSDLRNDEYYTTIQSELNYLLLHILSIESLVTYLIENKSRNKKYTFLPLFIGSEYYDSGHMTCLIFDNDEYKVYLYDPNGRTTFFNDIVIDAYTKIHKIKREDIDKELLNSMYINTSDLVDKLIIGYLDKINEVYEVKYNFISSKEWNKNNKVINRNFGDTIIGNGHCVITTIMFLHYLYTTGSKFENIYSIITNINDEELLYIINCYSNGIYNNIIRFIR